MKPRACAIIIRDGKLLTLRRRKEGREYHVLPGGKIEKGETPEEACVREAQEETGLTVTLGRKVVTIRNLGRTEDYYLVADFAGTVRLGGPEAQRNCPENFYALEWLSPEALRAAKFQPAVMREVCLDSLRAIE